MSVQNIRFNTGCITVFLSQMISCDVLAFPFLHKKETRWLSKMPTIEWKTAGSPAG